MRRIKRGENALFKRLLRKKDKTAFDRSNFHPAGSLTIDLFQNGRVIESYTYPSAYLRAGDASNEIELEVTTAVSNKFRGGKVVAKYTFVVPDAEFEGEGQFTDIITEEIMFVEQLP